jgi:hypothetical protein
MSRPTNFAELVLLFIDMIELAIPLLFSITLLYITWKVIDAWIIHGDGSQVEEGKNTVIVGVIALVVMSGIWGILAILQSSLFN